LNVALSFNAKPESETFHEAPSSIESTSPLELKRSVDTFAEWDTWETINAVKAAIDEFHDVTLIEADENCFEKFKQTRPDIVFNIAEGMNGISRESQIPALLDLLQIPYTGSDALTLGICLEKSRAKEILSYHKIPTAKFLVASSPEDIKKEKFAFPLIVKPISEGSSKGIFSSSFVKDDIELLAEVNRIVSEYNQPALIEEFLPGREFTVALLGNGDESQVLPIIEIKYEDFPKDVIPLYSYEAKWILDTKDNVFDVFECPAKLNKDLENQVKDISLKTYNVLNCKDWSRIDLRLDRNGIPNVIEINPLPGIMPDPNENSSYPKAARAAGMDYNQMIQSVLFFASKRYNLL
jgi:D-alanine-D-alanine ligase